MPGDRSKQLDVLSYIYSDSGSLIPYVAAKTKLYSFLHTYQFKNPLYIIELICLDNISFIQATISF